MEETKTVSVQEALRQTVDDLGRIVIPIALTESVAIPVARAINTLTACIDALEQSSRTAQTDG